MHRRINMRSSFFTLLEGSLVLLFLVYALLFPIIRQERLISQIEWTSVVVKQGDTLWAFAGVEGIDRRAVVDEIMRRNGCEAVLQVGQRLEVPIK